MTCAKIKNINRVRDALGEKQAKLILYCHSLITVIKYVCFAVKHAKKLSKCKKKKGLQIKHNHPHKSLEELLNHDQGISNHGKHVNGLLTEIYETFLGENYCFMKIIFRKRDVT